MEETILRLTKLLHTFLDSPVIPFDHNLKHSLPKNGGVYRLFETQNLDWQNSIYIGKSIDLQRRIYTNHLMGNRQASTLKRKMIKSGEYIGEIAVKKYLIEKCSLQVITIEDVSERIAFEHFAIAILKPIFND